MARVRRPVCAVGGCTLSLLAWLAASLPALAGATGEADLQAWLARLQADTCGRSYVGTFVVSSSSSLSSARIWHVCDGQQQVERVESLTGAPRSVFRHNERVLTVWSDTKLARSQKRGSLGLFPDRLRAARGSLAEHYRLQMSGQVDRVAGVEAEMVLLQPRDRLRFGYRVWVERPSGMVLKLQTLDAAGQVLEQSAFSELQMGAPIQAQELLRLMNQQPAPRQDKAQPSKISLEEGGWTLRQPVPGFQPVHCHRRAAQAASEPGLHCVFSDGLAAVSVFLEPGPGKSGGQTFTAMGATHTLRAQVHQHAATLMGEVPPATLQLFASALERRRASP